MAEIASEVPPAEACSALAATPLLAGIEPAGLELLASKSIPRRFIEREWIVREGEKGHSFFVLIEGEVEVVKHAGEAHEVTLARLSHRDFFGEMCIVDTLPRAASVRAATEVTALEITGGTLYQLFQKMPTQYSVLVLNLARDLARRLRSLDEAFAAKA